MHCDNALALAGITIATFMRKGFRWCKSIRQRIIDVARQYWHTSDIESLTVRTHSEISPQQSQIDVPDMLSPATYLVVITVLLVVYSINRKRRLAKLPPGPPRLPIIGNLHQAPREAIWLTFQKWVDQYGPLVSVDFGGTSLIIIGDYETARNLLDKRANIYSSRPQSVSISYMTSYSRTLTTKLR
jgi:hypothetical protein